METINIAEKLKGCPKGIELYVPFLGNVRLNSVIEGPYDTAQIHVEYGGEYQRKEGFMFNEDGSYDQYRNSECMLFPSKNQRDWSKFNPVFPPFEVKRTLHKPYYFVNSFGLVERRVDNNDTDSDFHWETKNYFNIYEQADYAVQKFKELLLSMRKEVKDE